jgi:hypothetical protein
MQNKLGANKPEDLFLCGVRGQKPNHGKFSVVRHNNLVMLPWPVRAMHRSIDRWVNLWPTMHIPTGPRAVLRGDLIYCRINVQT